MTSPPSSPTGDAAAPGGAAPIYNGRYELSNQIARGGTAQVYLARDLLLDRPVALKVLNRMGFAFSCHLSLVTRHCL